MREGEHLWGPRRRRELPPARERKNVAGVLVGRFLAEEGEREGGGGGDCVKNAAAGIAAYPPPLPARSLVRLWGRQTVREAPFVRRALQIGRPNLFFDIKFILSHGFIGRRL